MGIFLKVLVRGAANSMFRVPSDAGAEKSGSGAEKGGESRFFKTSVFEKI